MDNNHRHKLIKLTNFARVYWAHMKIVSLQSRELALMVNLIKG